MCIWYCPFSLFLYYFEVLWYWRGSHCGFFFFGSYFNERPASLPSQSSDLRLLSIHSQFWDYNPSTAVTVSLTPKHSHCFCRHCDYHAKKRCVVVSILEWFDHCRRNFNVNSMPWTLLRQDAIYLCFFYRTHSAIIASPILLRHLKLFSSNAFCTFCTFLYFFVLIVLCA